MSTCRFVIEQSRRNPREGPPAIAIGNSSGRSMDRSQSLYLRTATFVTIQLLLCSASLSVHTAEPEINEEVTFSNGEVMLAGTLTLHPSSGRHAAVFLISGSGPQDRDGATDAIPGYRPFAAIAKHLAKNGIAALRYDDRGVRGSSGDYGTATEPDFANDARATGVHNGVGERNSAIDWRIGGCVSPDCSWRCRIQGMPYSKSWVSGLVRGRRRPQVGLR